MRLRFVLPLLAALIVVAGCRDPKVTSYRVPKEQPEPLPPILTGEMPAAPAGGSMANTAVPTASGADLTWTAPAQWRPKPLSAMRKGSFAVLGADGAEADLSITAFPGDVGGLLANVNRWRGQVDLPPIAAADLDRETTRLEENGLDFVVVDAAGAGAESKRILGALVPFNGATWFFKLMGPDALVAAQKPAFLEFLQTVKPPPGAGDQASSTAPFAAPMSGAPAGDSMANTAVPTATGAELTWHAPADWQPEPLSAMRKGSFAVHGADGATADLSITAFPGDVGGVLANVNRWRGQVGLSPIADRDLAGAITQLDQNGLSFTVVDAAGPPGPEAKRILGALVPFGGSTWFFKLMGPEALVAREKPSFLAFLQTVQPPAATPERSTP